MESGCLVYFKTSKSLSRSLCLHSVFYSFPIKALSHLMHHQIVNSTYINWKPLGSSFSLIFIYLSLEAKRNKRWWKSLVVVWVLSWEFITLSLLHIFFNLFSKIKSNQPTLEPWIPHTLHSVLFERWLNLSKTCH